MTERRRGGRGRRGAQSGATARDIHGVVVVDKPSGLSSAQTVAHVKQTFWARRAGHTGTLDPMASGVLPICLGSATKLATFLLADDKVYEGELELGVETDTLDRDGTVTGRHEEEARAVDDRALADAMAGFVGICEQVPPMYSALKHGGRPLYRLARAGETVERAPRSVRIDRFELLGLASPRARFVVACSKGTYVRSLVADLGRRLGCGAHLTALRRTRSGNFALADAIQLDDMREEILETALIRPAQAVAHLPAFAVAGPLVPAVSCGQQLPWSEVDDSGAPPDGICRLLSPDGDLLALARVEGGKLRFERVFAVRA